jgi:hypothetical protein
LPLRKSQLLQFGLESALRPHKTPKKLAMNMVRHCLFSMVCGDF